MTTTADSVPGEAVCAVCAEIDSMPKPSPAFSFYPKDWLSDIPVMAMTHAARGMYITLLAMCWNEGSLPAEKGALEALILRRGDKKAALDVVKKRLRKCACGAKYYSARLLKERRKQLLRSEKARNSANARHHPDPCDRNATSVRSQCIPSPSPSPSPYSETPARSRSQGARESGAGDVSEPDADAADDDELEEARASVRRSYLAHREALGDPAPRSVAWVSNDDDRLFDVVRSASDGPPVIACLDYAMEHREPAFLWRDGRIPSFRRIAANLDQCVPPNDALRPAVDTARHGRVAEGWPGSEHAVELVIEAAIARSSDGDPAAAIRQRLDQAGLPVHVVERLAEMVWTFRDRVRNSETPTALRSQLRRAYIETRDEFVLSCQAPGSVEGQVSHGVDTGPVV